MESKIKRISGYDFARALAIIGMIFVNFKVVMGMSDESGILFTLVDSLSGKAAALFVVLAGIGMTLMYNSAKQKNDPLKIKQVKVSLLKRALFLFVVGLSYYFIWPADILHYYGLFLVIGVLFISSSKRTLIAVSSLLVFAFIIMLFIFDYEKGWDWNVLEYQDFFTVNGFFRNLFFNGFHPVIPWAAFLLTGIWVGRIDFNNKNILAKTMFISLMIFLVTKVISMISIFFLTQNVSPGEIEDIKAFFGTEPMPPSFFYMITGSSLAVFIITISIYITEKLKENNIIKALIYTGQLALSIYIAHVVIGMLAIEVIFGVVEQSFSIEFIVIYATLFSLASVIFSVLWRKKYKRGPLEKLMRIITG